LLRQNKLYQHHLEEEVKRRTAELHQAQKLEAIGTLAAGIAHDFNNILGAIVGFTELALLKSNREDDVFQDLHQVKLGCRRAKELVSLILTFSRKASARRDQIRIAPIIKEAIKLLRATIPTTVEIRQHISDEPHSITADATEIHQIVMNLCTNAYHALIERQGTIEVTLQPVDIEQQDLQALHLKNTGHYLQLQVRDNGTGMEQDVLERIFDPFFTTKEAGQGTGLGLSVTHGIVQECNGSIVAESTPGRGSCFSLFFPIVASRKTQRETALDNLPRGDASILFVDDEEPLRILARNMLEYLGYTVTTCATGIEAIELFEQDPDHFDMVITDQSMPGIPGIELARVLVAKQPTLPVLLCTGYSSVVEEAKAEQGISGFLLKPLSIGTLAREVQRLLVTST
jgi:nitrogen-specific signal transduction histidine kinase